MVRLCDYATVFFSYLHIGFLTFLALLKKHSEMEYPVCLKGSINVKKSMIFEILGQKKLTILKRQIFLFLLKKYALHLCMPILPYFKKMSHVAKYF